MGVSVAVAVAVSWLMVSFSFAVIGWSLAGMPLEHGRVWAASYFLTRTELHRNFIVIVPCTTGS